MRHRSLLTYLTSFIFAASAFSQNLEYFEKMKSKYPEHSIIQLNFVLNIDVLLADDKLQVTEKFLEESMLLKDDASLYNKYSVYSNSMVKLSNFTSQTKVLKGNSYKSYDNENIEVINDIGSSAFYDDQKKHTMRFENLQKGSIRKINYELNYKDAHFFGLCPLWNYIPTDNMEIKIKCSKSVDLEVKCFNCNTEQSNFIVTEDSKNKFYTLHLKDLPENKSFNGSPNHRWYLPHLVFRVKSYKSSTEQKNFLNDVADLYKWYSSLLSNLPKLTSPALIKITDSLSKSSDNESEKVKNVFKWVQKNIKYVAFEDGMGGYVPRDPSLVFQKKYGDCKDMAFLIYSMLKHAGIPSYLTWIGTRNLPYSYSNVPSPLTNDHMIACYVTPTKEHIFLDATDKFISFGFPSAFTQGKQGLLAEVDKFADTVYVPVVPSYKNVKNDTCFLRIEDQKLLGTSKMHFTGYKRVDFLTEVYAQRSENLKDYYQREFQKGNNKFFLDNIKFISDYNDTTSFLSFDFTVTDYVTKIKDEQFLNLNLEDDLPLTIFQESYTTPYELDYSYINKYVKVLEIPQDYKVVYIPENYSFSSEDYGVDIKYELKQNKLINTFTFRISSLLIEHKSLDKWNNFIININRQKNNTITLQYKK